MSGSAYITDSDVKEYQSIYKEKFGKEIDSTEARAQLSKLVRQMEIVYQPITKEQFDKYNKNKPTQD